MENQTEEKKDLSADKKREIKTTAELISFAFEIGYTISVPIVILVVLGKFMDNKFASAPLFMISGLILSIFSTSYLIYKKTKTLL